MGRGRAKAKQTRIARELKYADVGGDLARLEAELKTTREVGGKPHVSDAEEYEVIDDE
jgi:hypothetical protein